MLPRNVGGLDRLVRLLLGLLLLPAGLFLFGPDDALRWPALVLGLAGLLSGTTRYCPLLRALWHLDDPGQSVKHPVR